MQLDVCPTCGAKPLPFSVVCQHDATELVTADHDPMLGQMVGTYRVIRRLGIGGMGAVYEGLEANIEKRAALKIVHPHLSADPRLPPLLAEARAVNAIGDEGIVDIFAFGTLPDGRSYLVMELLEGEGLDVRLAREKLLTVPEAIDILVPLLQALEAAHASGFVHRDIKSANVFIVRRTNRAPFPKLLDFGIAQQIKVGSPDAMGTPAYIAPEQAANVNVGAKADLYALGCLMFEMLSGQLPFVGESWNELLRAHREAPRPSLSLHVDVPPALDALVQSMMSTEAAHRPASAAAVRAELLRIREEVLRAPPLPAPAPAPPPSRRPLWALVAAIAVLALGLGGYAVTRPADVVAPPPRAVEDPIATAAAQVAADVERQLETSPPRAVDALLGAEASFPGRPAWVALRGRLGTTLRREAEAALQKDDADHAAQLLASLGKLSPVGKDDPLSLAVKRTSFALHNGMVHVGDVFIDRYEYPNRQGAVPTTEVDWADAVKLCEDAGKHLCTEQEWEAACRNGDAAHAYPYGATYEKGRCVSKDKKNARAAASGSRPGCVTPAGVFDLSGNVAEWTSSALQDDKPQRVHRGGSFGQGDPRLSCESRDYRLPGLGGEKSLGLRCCL